MKITGFKTSVDTDLLQKNAVPALVAKMRATRASQLLKLQAAMINKKGGNLGPTPLSAYSVEQGLIDLNAYYNAGTFVSALQDITATAAEEKKAADEKINQTKPNAKLITQTPNAPGGRAGERTKRWILFDRRLGPGVTADGPPRRRWPQIQRGLTLRSITSKKCIPYTGTAASLTCTKA